MNAPVTIPCIKPLDPRMKKGVRVVEDFIAPDGEIVQRMFDSDGATIPRACWSIVGSPYDPDILPAALGHDWDYWTRRIPRAEADDKFYRNLREWGCGKARATAMHKAVRLFGGSYFKRAPIDIEYARIFAAHLKQQGIEPLFLKYFPEIQDL